MEGGAEGSGFVRLGGWAESKVREALGLALPCIFADWP